jgi:hypothetical protein
MIKGEFAEQEINVIPCAAEELKVVGFVVSPLVRQCTGNQRWCALLHTNHSLKAGGRDTTQLSSAQVV